MIPVLYRFQYYHDIEPMINVCGSFEASRLLDKSCTSYYWRQESGTLKSKIIQRLKHSNRTVNPFNATVTYKYDK